MRQFWMVQGDGPSRVRHTTETEAWREATRLARENPGCEFYVMEAVSAHRKLDVEHIDFRPQHPCDEIPF